MIVKAELKKGISKKSGKEYIALFVEFPNGFKKVYFPQGLGEQFAFEDCIQRFE